MKNAQLFCCCLLILLFSAFLKAAADYPAVAKRSYTELEAGQLNDRLRARVMTQDAYGFVWFGGSTGLWRYDGYQLRHLAHEKDNENSLRDNDIYALAADHKGGLWINTGHHISHYDIQSETYTHYSAALGDDSVPVSTELNHIVVDSEGGVWFSGFNGVSYLAEGSKRFINYGLESNLADGQEGFIARAAMPAKNGDVYLSTSLGLALKKKNESSFHYLYREGEVSLLGIEVTYTLEDSNGVLWIGTMKDGIFWVGSDGKLQHQSRRDGAYGILAGTKAWMMLLDGDDIWVLTSKSGVFILDALTAEIKSHEGVDELYPYGLDLIDTRVGLRLQSGQMIFSGDPGENGDSKIQMFSPQKDYVRWVHRSKINGAKRQDILTGVNVGEDILLFGKKVTRFNIDKGVLPLNSKALDQLGEQLKANPGFLSHVDPQGRIWVSTINAVTWLVDLRNDSLEKLNIGGEECTAYDSHYLTAQYLAYECVDDAGVVLVNTEEKSRKYFAYDHKANFIMWGGITELDNQDVIIGSSVGVMILGKEDREKEAAKFKPIALEGVRTGRVFRDAKKTLWVDSDIGVFSLDKDKPWSELKMRHSDNSQNFMHFAHHDQYGRIWGGGGFLDAESKSFVSLGADDGYRMNNSYFGDPIKLANDLWAVSHVEGLQIINPDYYKDWQFNTPLRVSALRFDGQRQKGVSFSEITLTPDIRKLSIDVVALDFESNFRKQYHYILEGYNKNWQKGGNENRHIVFENLPVGSYTLRIKGSSYRGVISGEELTLKIEVLPAWYQSWWFRALMLAALLITMLMIIRYRERYLQEKRRELEQLVALGTAELADKNKELSNTLDELHSTQESLIEQEKVLALGKMVKGLAHEVNTPLGVAVTAVSDVESRTENLKADFESGALSAEKLQEFINIQSRSSQVAGKNLGRAHELISSFRELGLDNNTDVKGDVDVVDFIEKVCENLEGGDKESYRYKIHGPDSLVLQISPSDFSSLLNRLLSNCLMHAQMPGQLLHIDLYLDCSDKGLEMRIRDNGPGIAEENVREIFEPFFTTLRAQGGIGLGLSFVYNLVVHKMNGSIQLNTDYKEGAEFVIKLPLSC